MASLFEMCDTSILLYEARLGFTKEDCSWRYKLTQNKSGRPFNWLPATCLISTNYGEPWRARTSDPLIKSQLLYQLS